MSAHTIPPDYEDDLLTFLQSVVDPSNIPIAWTNAEDIDFADKEGGQDVPKIAIEGSRTAGGTEGVDPGGGGSTQWPQTTVQVDCWGGTEATDRLEETGVHPDELATALRSEVWRAVQANEAGPAGYHRVRARTPYSADDDSEGDVAYREIVPVQLYWQLRA